jgi:nucleoside-diphosphate-sugar epimerase
MSTIVDDPIRDIADLETRLSEPTPRLIEAFRRIEGDILVLGVGGKMGPTLARMAVRASQSAGTRRRVIGVARFSSPDLPARLNSWGVETIKCDLLDREGLRKLPDAPNVIFMAGMKFGCTGQESLTWAMNCLLPGLVCERFPRGRFVAFSTGNVYPLTPASGGGATEASPVGPIGEYAMSCLGRERVFEHFSRTLGLRAATLRLTYANEMRYGVLVDLARKVQEGRRVDLSMGHVNVIWQGDANAQALESLAHAASPPLVLNITGTEQLSVRRICEQYGEWLGSPPVFTGQEATDALLVNARLAHELLGPPCVTAMQLMRWAADWVARGGESLGKPTHFEVRDGKF